MSLQLKLEEISEPTEGEIDQDEGEVIEARKADDSVVEEARSSEQGVKDEEEIEGEDEEDDEDPKPRSFGKVAMASPQGGSIGNPPFPTVFASISLMSQVCPSWSLIVGRLPDLCQNEGILGQYIPCFFYKCLFPELKCFFYGLCIFDPVFFACSFLILIRDLVSSAFFA